jgi:hypothetical protein
MRVKIIRWTDPTSSHVTLRVQRWCDGQWEKVIDFPLHESEQANEFAMKLSMTKRVPVEMAVFEDGRKIQADLSRPVFISGAVSGEEASENQS